MDGESPIPPVDDAAMDLINARVPVEGSMNLKRQRLRGGDEVNTATGRDSGTRMVRQFRTRPCRERGVEWREATLSQQVQGGLLAQLSKVMRGLLLSR